eukprot:1122173-Amphidinium_carterae.2
MLPHFVASEATSHECYYPVTTPVQWNADCIIPPYEDFYVESTRTVSDGCQASTTPCLGLPTGQEHVPSRLLVMKDAYHNRMVQEWVHRNRQRREQAHRRSEILGMEYSRPKMPSAPNAAGNDPTKREKIWLSLKFKLVIKTHREAQAKQKQQDAEEAERIRQMNAAANLPHMAAGLKLEWIQQHEGEFSTDEPTNSRPSRSANCAST